MKLFKLVLLLYVILILNSCALFTKKAQIKNISCSDQDYAKLQEALDFSFKKVQACLNSNARMDDLNKLNELFNSEKGINLSCSSKNKSITVLAEAKASKYYPGFLVNHARIKDDLKSEDNFKREFFHEIIHLLGYEHAQSYDLSEIAEMCCWYETDPKLSAASKNSCKLFKYSNSQWTSADYLKSFSEALADFGNTKLAVKTALSASSVHAKRKDYDKSQQAALSVLKVLSRSHASDRLSRKRIRELKSSSGAAASLIISKLGFAGKNEESLLFSRKVYNSVKNNFYSAPIDEEKLKFFDNISQTLNNLILLDPQNFVKSWVDLRDRSLYVCRDLKETEKSDIESIMSGYNALVFSFKNDISAGDFYEIATYWSNPCDLQKSYRAEAGK